MKATIKKLASWFLMLVFTGLGMVTLAVSVVLMTIISALRLPKATRKNRKSQAQPSPNLS
ncbi:MAG TPA: hypothetical protein V6D33_13860 [Cyanophyceae cyanobacterium]